MRVRSLLVLAAVASAGATVCAAAPLSPRAESHAESVESKCRLVAQEQGGTRRAVEAATKSCVAQVAPSLAYWETCRQKARRHHLSGLKLRDDVTFCMSREP